MGSGTTPRTLVGHIQFGNVLLSWMSGFLLFAGAMSIELGELARQRGITAGLSIFGTVASTFLIGALAWLVNLMLRLKLSWLNCLTLGALLSPTDPVAVLALVRRTAPQKHRDDHRRGIAVQRRRRRGDFSHASYNCTQYRRGSRWRRGADVHSAVIRGSRVGFRRRAGDVSASCATSWIFRSPCC